MLIISSSIGLISILAILAAGTIWLQIDSKGLDHTLTTVESDQRNAYRPSLTTFEALTLLGPHANKLHTSALDVSSPIRTTAPYITGAGDCSDVYRAGRNDSGVYTITLQGQTVPVYCDMGHGGGWTVFHNRMDGSIDFYGTWVEYKAGFGDLEGEFWWGNDHLATITATKQYTLRVDMSDWDGDTAYALYTNFRVSAESDNYRLTAEGYTGTARNSLGNYSSGWGFSTRDRDNDGCECDCAADMHAAGWFFHCASANPNGLYGDRHARWKALMSWWHWKHGFVALKAMSMKVRPTHF